MDDFVCAMRQIKDFFNHEGTSSLRTKKTNPSALRRAAEESPERKQPMARLTLVECNANWTRKVPILKYTLLVGTSLLAIIIVAGHMTEPTPADVATNQSSSSLELLRKMANHGESKPFASAAAAGPFLAMPTLAVPSVLVAFAPVDAAKPIDASIAKQPSVLDSQARLVESDVGDKPLRPAKKAGNRKPKPRLAYVENGQRGPGGYFGGFQSW